MKLIFLSCCLIFVCINARAQKAAKDTTGFKEGIAVGEAGGASSTDIKSGKASYGYSLSVEATPIENWLEVELGVSPTYAKNYRETDIDFLVKKPWDFSRRLEFMLGVGPEWAHSTSLGVSSNSWSGEIALDFMYWPFKKHQFGFYAEPAYVYGFETGHEQSIEMSAGLLINIP
ncbi:MAG TPA: hypothetical protein VHA52_06855 [Candidatus Babeliaceae bacterium]|nr:hypothetical protein [Candidatus Babeliaceae bacterium]